MRKLYFCLFFTFLAAQAFSQNYTVLGSASSYSGCNCFQLTPDADDQAGAIFQNQTLNLNNSFDFTFNVFLGCNGGGGADGIVFVLTSNPNGLGNQGEGMGYAGGNQPYSFAVEFDTWQNGNAGDPGADHIGINSGGLYSHNTAGAVPALTSGAIIDDCAWHTVRVVWDVNTNTFSVYFDGVLRQQIIVPNMVGSYFGGNPIVNWGWSGATGGGSNQQIVCVLSTSNWVAGVNYQSCSPTMQFTDISTSNVGAIQSWAWDFGDGTTSTLQNPSHTYVSNGTFNVSLTITGVNGCANTYTHAVVIAAPISLAPTIVPPPCNGGTNGSVTVAASGGFGVSAGYGGYTYNWNSGAQQGPTWAVGAGTYTVSVTDGVCSITAQYTVNQPPALTATTSHTDAPCGSNGTATLTASGGTPPYVGVNWAGTAGVSGSPVSMPPGTWIADFHDANGCSALLQYTETITALPCGITSTVTSTNVSCFGGSDGSVTLLVTGVVGAPVITWNPGGIPGGNGAPLTGLTAGTYTYSFSDNIPSHTFSGSITLTQPGAAMAASITTIDMSCANTNDGQALVSITSGGTSPFNYTWSPAQANNPLASPLSAGAISVTVTDASGCTATATGTVTGPPTLTLNVTSVDDSCYQSETGSATANATGGNPPFTYFWSNISSAQTNLSLGTGTYTVTVTDSRNCTITGSATINQPTPFTHTPLSPSHINCFGAATGAIATSASGGIPAYTYTWSPSGTGNNPTGLTAGQYNVTIADANNCTILDSVVLTQPATALTVTTSHTDVTCNGGSDGTLTINISGGTPTYTFLGNIVPAGTTVIPNQAAGTYAGNVLDGNNCTVAVSETIAEPAALVLGEQHIDALCFGGTQGSVDLTIGGGTSPYTYAWSNGATTEDLTGITAGTYTVTTTDASLCTATISATITEPAAPVMTIAVTNVSCFGGNGSATATPSGGNAPFSYLWSGAGGTTGQTVTKPAGSYTVTATDASTCQQTASLTITEPAAVTIAEIHTDLQCFGDADGDITLTPSGGTGPNYTYAWSIPGSTNMQVLLVAGTYDATVTDQATCTATISVTLTEPTQLSINIQQSSISCFGANDGSITITTSGGTLPYTYTWNPNVTTTNSASSLGPGNYAITISDFNNCSINPNITLTEPSQPLSVTPSQTDLTCFESADGTASVIANGGTAPYAFAWGPNVSTTFSATGLAAGNYDLTVTDNNGCTVNNLFVITQPTQLTTSETHVNVLCSGNTTGSIDITATGGAPGYAYTWTPNVSTTNTATGVGAGLYSVIVSDTNACTAMQTVTITEPPLLTLATTPTAVLCFGTATGIINSTPNGGVPNYTFSATDGVNTFNSSTGQFSSLIAGTYGVVVTDQNACTATSTAIVTEPVVLANVTDVVPATCYHYSDGSVTVTPSGGTPAYSFSISSGETNSTGTFNGLSAGTYTVTVTDFNGCSLSNVGTVTEPDSVTLSVTPTPVEVKLGNTLQLSTTTNTTGSVTYDWSPKFGLSCYDCANPVFDGIYSQPYNVIVTTSAGCTGTAQFEVTVIPNYDVFIPNAFTPNGDGVNDFWQIFGNMPAIKQIEVMVFNRIGEKVFESTDINFAWDGSYQGKHSPPGVYSYVAKFVWLNNHSDARYKGTVTLLH